MLRCHLHIENKFWWMCYSPPQIPGVSKHASFALLMEISHSACPCFLLQVPRGDCLWNIYSYNSRHTLGCIWHLNSRSRRCWFHSQVQLVRRKTSETSRESYKIWSFEISQYKWVFYGNAWLWLSCPNCLYCI